MKVRPKGYLSSPAISDSTETLGSEAGLGDLNTSSTKANTGHQAVKWSEKIPVALGGRERQSNVTLPSVDLATYCATSGII